MAHRRRDDDDLDFALDDFDDVEDYRTLDTEHMAALIVLSSLALLWAISRGFRPRVPFRG
jgi:hypothetical protein